MVKNNRTNFEGLHEDQAEQARLAAEEMAREKSTIREEESRHEKSHPGNESHHADDQADDS